MGVVIRQGSYHRIPSGGALSAQHANSGCRSRAGRAARGSLPLLIACVVSSLATYAVVCGLQQRAAAAHQAEARLDALAGTGAGRQLPGGGFGGGGGGAAAASNVFALMQTPEGLQIAAAARLLEREMEAEEEARLRALAAAAGGGGGGAAAAAAAAAAQARPRQPAVQPKQQQAAAAVAAVKPLPLPADAKPHPLGTPAASQQHAAAAAAAAAAATAKQQQLKQQEQQKQQQAKHEQLVHQQQLEKQQQQKQQQPAAPTKPHTIAHEKDPGSRSPARPLMRPAPAPHAVSAKPGEQRKVAAPPVPFGISGKMTVALVNNAPYHLEIVAGWLHVLRSMQVELIWYQAGQFTPDGNFTPEELLAAQVRGVSGSRGCEVPLQCTAHTSTHTHTPNTHAKHTHTPNAHTPNAHTHTPNTRQTHTTTRQTHAKRTATGLPGNRPLRPLPHGAGRQPAGPGGLCRLCVTRVLREGDQGGEGGDAG
jgi:hypothetical protein